MSGRADIRRTGLQLAAIGVVMAGLSFAAVPFYDWFCRTTGFGGTPLVAVKAPDVVLDQMMIVRFDGSLDAGMAWTFAPQQRKMTVRLGETGLAFFRRTTRPTG